jgi:iron complex transport system ATP-binding protein
MPPPPAVRLEGVGVGYGSRTVLHDIRLEVPAGQIVAVTGPNGAGKTTLLRTLLGFLPADSGTVELFGRPVGSMSIRERARAVAWVPQSEVPRDDVAVEEYVLFGRYSHQRPFEGEGPHDRAIARAALHELDLADRGRDGILSLSGGERQRAVLARAIAQESPLLLLDEPTSQLDIGHQLDVLDRVRALARKRGVTVLAAIHDLNLASRYADRIVVLFRGRIFADGPPARVLSESLLAEVWGVEAELRRDAPGGTPYLLPHRPLPRGPEGAAVALWGPVHVVGGGGAASPILRTLVEAGYRVTAGALHLLDSDQETAETLQVPAAVEAPFAPLGAEVRKANALLLREAQAIVVAPFAVGPSNVANLEDVAALAGTRPVLLVAHPARQWDFTVNREGVSLWSKLREQGAEEVPGTPELRSRLDAIRGASGPNSPPDARATGG